MTDIYNRIIQELSSVGIESPRLEARIILSEVLHCQADEISGNVVLDSENEKFALDLLQKRLKRMPLDKIIGRKWFYKHEFIVNEDVLSPRPETEILLEATLDLLYKVKDAKILDLGTGSGCIITSLLKEIPSAKGTAVDISSKALEIAQLNADRLQVANRLHFINADWNDKDFIAKIGQQFDVIVSNPPYIPQKDIADLTPEVKNFDPILALDGGLDGFDCYKQIADITPYLLKDNGYIFVEAGIGQAEKIATIFAKHNLNLVDIVKDLAGIERCVILHKP